MKKLFFLFTLIFFLLPICKSQKSTKKIGTTIHQVGISIKQNGKIVQPKDGVITLEKAVFDFILDFPKPMTVLVNASFEDKLYHSIAEGNQLANRTEFSQSNLIAVSLQNAEQTFYLSEESSSPWFYQDEEYNNFNKVESVNNHYQCTKTIRHFFPSAYGKNESIENIDRPIYMIFAPNIIEENDSCSIHFQGKTLRIEWKENNIDFSNSKIERNFLYKGTLKGNLNIQLYLEEREHPCGGNSKIINAMYKYDSQEEWLLLNVTTDKNNRKYCLVEDYFTGVLFLEKKGNTFNGKWINPDTKKQFKVELKRVELGKMTIEKLNKILFDDLLYNKNDC